MSNEYESMHLPRPDLLEENCRRFEGLISQAAVSSFVYNPEDFPSKRKGLNQRTFVARFNDAMLGFEKFKYKSTIIPEGFNRKRVKVYPMVDGRVHIVNEDWEQTNRSNRVDGAFDKERMIGVIVAFTHGKYLSSGQPHPSIEGYYDGCIGKELSYETEAQAAWLISKISELQPKAEWVNSEKRKVVVMRYSDMKPS